MTVMSAASAATKPAPAPAGANPDLVRFENAELLAILDAGSPIVINAATFDDRRVVIMPMRV